MIKKTERGYMLDIRPDGRNGRRIRRTFPTITEARAFQKHILSEGDTVPKKGRITQDDRRLSDLANIWYRVHGHTLKTGSTRLKELQSIILKFENPVAISVTASSYVEWRAKRLESVTSNTVNHDLAYLKSMFNELIRFGEWTLENPLINVKKIKMDETERSYLDQSQIKILLSALDGRDSDAGMIARLCLATGARWGEVANLQRRQVRRGMIHLTNTKNGHNRSIPISESLHDLLIDRLPLQDGFRTFQRVASTLPFFPPGQLTHILRHTFASHFMMNGGSILTLQKILGHGDIKMTMRYAHLHPDHLRDAVTLNPLEHSA